VSSMRNLRDTGARTANREHDTAQVSPSRSECRGCRCIGMGSRATPAGTEWSVREFHAKRGFLRMRGRQIAYADRGTGPGAFFLHGWPLNGYHWRGSMARLSNIRRCIAVDFMGLGYTEVPADEDLSPQSQAEMIVAVMDALKTDCTDLISNDSGTAIAQLNCSKSARSHSLDANYQRRLAHQ
jgi:hypothetical protein